MNAEDREYVDVIVRNAKRLQRLTEEILDVTKIESQSLRLDKEGFNLNDVILNCINDVKAERYVKDEKNLPVFYEPKDIFVDADRGRVAQVISNLLSNAIKFTAKEGALSITINRISNYDGDVAIVTVKDTGQGVEFDMLPKLFTKFATRSFSGTGLGLYISKSIVEAHGGKIWAENNIDSKGAKFSFSLPIRAKHTTLNEIK